MCFWIVKTDESGSISKDNEKDLLVLRGIAAIMVENKYVQVSYALDTASILLGFESKNDGIECINKFAKICQKHHVKYIINKL